MDLKKLLAIIQDNCKFFNDYLDQVATAFEDTDSFPSRIEGKGDVKTIDEAGARKTNQDCCA